MDESIFSKIIRREVTATIVYEDDDLIAIKDIHPKAPVHILIITKQPFATLEEVPEESEQLHAKLLLTARKVAKDQGIEENYKLHMNVGRKVQDVHHVHLHLLGGWRFGSDSTKVDL